MKKTLFDTSTLSNSQKVQLKYFLIMLPFMLTCLFLFESWFAKGFWILVFLIAGGKSAEKEIEKKLKEKMFNKE